MDNEYEDARCPECDENAVNPEGFCEECGFDYECWMVDTINRVLGCEDVVQDE